MVVNPVMSGGANFELVNGQMIYDGYRAGGTVYYNDESFQATSMSGDGATFKAVNGSLLAANAGTLGWTDSTGGLEKISGNFYKVTGDFTIIFRA